MIIKYYKYIRKQEILNIEGITKYISPFFYHLPASTVFIFTGNSPYFIRQLKVNNAE